MELDNIIQYLTPSLQNIVKKLNRKLSNSINEIRLRVNQPLMVCTSQQNYFIDSEGNEHLLYKTTYKAITEREINEIFLNICEHSIHSHINEISNGYITIKGGHRVGICGKSVMENEHIINFVDITSLNFRIARQICGAANELIKQITLPPENMLIVGPPACGKTTILRDLCRQLSLGVKGETLKCVIIDERNELANVYKKAPLFDVGPACDVFAGTPKAMGIEIATRTLAPDIIAFDEMSKREEISAVIDSLNCGVNVITTMHASSEQELHSKFEKMGFAKYNPFTKWVFLHSKHKMGMIKKIVNLKEFNNENVWNNASINMFDKHRHDDVVCAEKKAIYH